MVTHVKSLLSCTSVKGMLFLYFPIYKKELFVTSYKKIQIMIIFSSFLCLHFFSS